MSWAIHARAPAADSIDLGDFLPREPTWQEFQRTGSSNTLAFSEWVGEQRILRQFAILPGGGLKALDETRFTLDSHTFAETEQYRSEGGPNLHHAPIELPRRLQLGQWHRPFGDVPARVRLAAHERLDVVMSPDAAPCTIRAATLEAEQGNDRRIQILAAGLGEVALGPVDGSFDRWLLRASNPTTGWGGGVPSALMTGPLPPLAASSEARPRRDLL